MSEAEAHVLESIRERTSPEPDGRQDNTSNIWTGRNRVRADASSSSSPLSRDEVDGVVDGLVGRGDVFEWHGLLAPATEDHLRAIIENERECEITRKLVIAKVNRRLSDLRENLAGGDDDATDGDSDV